MASGYVGDVVAKWLVHAGADRKMALVEPFGFIDPTGGAWPVPKGAVIDGASIPSWLWTPVGSPFIGDYRRTSVVHDHYCTVRTRPTDAVHRMFYDGCRADGVSEQRAKLMYAAVKSFGPRWDLPASLVARGRMDALFAGKDLDLKSDMNADRFAALQRWIERTDPSIEEIDQEVEAHLRIYVAPAAPV